MPEQMAGTEGYRHRLLAAFDAAPVAIAVVGAEDRRVEYANARCRQMFGGCREGAPAEEAFPQLARRRLLAHLDDVVETGQPYRAEDVPVADAGGQDSLASDRFFSFTFSAVASGAGPADVLLVAVDISEQVVARQRMSLLARAAVRFAASLDLQEALQAISDTIVPRLARGCVIDLVEGSGLRRAFVSDIPGHPQAAEILSQAGAVRLADDPAMDAMRRRVPVVVDAVPPDQMTGTHISAEARALARDVLEGEAMVSVPLVRGDLVVGVVTMLGADRRAPMGAVDVALLQQLAVPAAEAIDNAQRFSRQREAALVLQRSLLSPPMQSPGLEVAVRYRPARRGSEVGGDWYDAFHVPGDHLGVLVGDVVGHDLAAAASMGRLRSIVQAVACDTAASPAEVLRRVDKLNADLQVAELATVVYGHVEGNGPTRLFRWSSAGHPPPLLVGSGGVQVLEDGMGLVLGVETSAGRPEGTAAMEPGATVILYTDGLVESPSQGLEEGTAILVESAARYGHLGLEEFCDRLLEEAPGGDDVALLALRVTASSASAGSPPAV
jgi:hypothetical protein